MLVSRMNMHQSLWIEKFSPSKKKKQQDCGRAAQLIQVQKDDHLSICSLISSSTHRTPKENVG